MRSNVKGKHMGGGGSEGIPGEPPKSEILIQWIHAFAAAVAKAFLTSH
jgi:hypothetical protein